jgi:hypothetical protein
MYKENASRLGEPTSALSDTSSDGSIQALPMNICAFVGSLSYVCQAILKVDITIVEQRDMPADESSKAAPVYIHGRDQCQVRTCPA